MRALTGGGPHFVEERVLYLTTILGYFRRCDQNLFAKEILVIFAPAVEDDCSRHFVCECGRAVCLCNALLQYMKMFVMSQPWRVEGFIILFEMKIPCEACFVLDLLSHLSIFTTMFLTILGAKFYAACSVLFLSKLLALDVLSTILRSV